MEKLIGNERIIIDPVDIGLPCRIFFRNRYAPYLFHASEIECTGPNVEHEVERDRLQFNDLVAECKELLISVGKILENMAVKGTDLKPPALIETEVVDDAKPEPEVEKLGQKLLLSWHHCKKWKS